MGHQFLLFLFIWASKPECPVTVFLFTFLLCLDKLKNLSSQFPELVIMYCYCSLDRFVACLAGHDLCSTSHAITMVIIMIISIVYLSSCLYQKYAIMYSWSLKCFS